MDEELGESDYLSLDEFQKIVYQKREDEIVRLKTKSLDCFLKNYQSLEERNRKILDAIGDGYKQSEIARYLGLSSAGVSYIVRITNK